MHGRGIRMRTIDSAIRNFLCIVLFAAIAFFGAVVPGSASYADTTGYTTDRYNVKIDVNTDNSYDYTENITVNFNEARHGIYRNIPLDSEYRISDIHVSGYDYEVYTESGNKVIKIGSSDSYVDGRVTYTIKYTLRGVKDPKQDIMYFDALPTGWETPIANANVTVNLPDDMKWKSIKCFTGSYGGENDKYGTWDISLDDHYIKFSATDLPTGVGATVNAQLPDNYWRNELSYDWMEMIALACLLLTVGLMIFFRVKYGRDPEVVETVEFYPPEDLSSIDIGYVIDGTVDDRDIISGLFYMADKGYISIKEYDKKKFEFTKVKIPEKEKPAVQDLFKGLFGKGAMEDPLKTNETVRMEDISEDMGEAFSNVKESVDDDFQGRRKLFTKKSKSADAGSKFMFAFSIIVTLFISLAYKGNLQDGLLLPVICCALVGILFTAVLGMIARTHYKKNSRKGARTVASYAVWTIVYIAIGALYLYWTCLSSSTGFSDVRLTAMTSILLITSPLLICGMRARSEWSASVLGKVLGFKKFIAEAELDKLNELVEKDPSYFYNILPYAYVFGLTKKWASNFEKINVPKPDWYSPYGIGNDYVFDVLFMNSMLHNVTHDVSSHITIASQDSGSSLGGGGGFGGGGFSGGGFGGGGGGAW